MNQPFMSNPDQHPSQHPFVWQLPAREAVTLKSDAAPRALWVHEGRVWLTRHSDSASPDDIWLEAGQSHLLPAGSEWVVEAWPVARVTLAQAAPVPVKPRQTASWARAWHAATHVGRAWA